MIKSIRIKDFKCYRDQKVNFAPLTVFAGENAAGKSSIIQSILILAEINKEKTRLNYFDNKKINYIDVGESYAIGEIQLNQYFNLHLGSFREIRNSNPEDNSIYFEVEKYELNNICGIELVEDKKSIMYIMQKCNSDFELSDTKLKYLYAERFGPRITQKTSSNKELFVGYQGEFVNQIILDCFDDQIDEKLLIQKVYNKDVEEIFLGKQIEHWMNFITPGIELFPEGHVKLSMTSMGIRRKGFTEEFLNPYNIGFGVTYVLPIIVNCLISKPRDVIIIENPEAHLHPKAQTQLGMFLCQVASAGIQVIIETHSDHIIDGMRRAVVDNIMSKQDIIINFNSVVNDEMNRKIYVEQLEIDVNGEINHWPDGFMSQKSDDMEAILFSRMERRKK